MLFQRISIATIHYDLCLGKTNCKITLVIKLTCLHRLAVLQDHMACKLCLMGSHLLLVKKKTQLVYFKIRTASILFLIKHAAACSMCARCKKSASPDFTDTSIHSKSIEGAAYHTAWCGSSSADKHQPEHRQQHTSANLCTPLLGWTYGSYQKHSLGRNSQERHKDGTLQRDCESKTQTQIKIKL